MTKDSQTETFAALKLEINSWRWKGVPFYIRAGKFLATTCTEIVGKFHKPPTLIPDSLLVENHLRLRLSPEVTNAIGMTELDPSAEGLFRRARWWHRRSGAQNEHAGLPVSDEYLGTTRG